MQKDFDKWNEIKKETDKQILPKEFFCYEREIWWCSLGVNIGIETDGKNDKYERPVIIVKVFNKEMIWILPITYIMRNKYFCHNFVFDGMDQSVVITQIKTISAKRLIRKIGSISEQDFEIVLSKLIKIIKTKPPFGGISEAEATNMASVSNEDVLSTKGVNKINKEQK